MQRVNTHKPPSMNNILFCEMSGLIDFYSQNYKKIVIMGDFNMQTNNSNFHTIYESHELFNLAKHTGLSSNLMGQLISQTCCCVTLVTCVRYFHFSDLQKCFLVLFIMSNKSFLLSDYVAVNES